MKQIVHLETGRHLYGGVRQVAMLMDGLVRQGIACTLVCPPDSEISTAVHPDVRVHTMPMAGDLDMGFTYRFSKWLGKEQPALVHVHSRRGADMWGGLGARWAGIPAVISRRVDNPEPAILAPMKYRRYERVIAISDGIRKALSKVGVPEQKLRLVHSAVDAENCQPQWTREQFLEAFGLDSKHLVVVCAAQLIPRKGHSILLDAWSEVSSAVPSARLLLFGSGSEAPALRARLQQSVAGGTVQLLGFRADLRAFLGHADLVVHPALMEGLGVALLEAQAAGVPVIATRVGGIPEAIADKKSGLLVDPDSADALSHALVYALRDAALRERLGAGGRAHVAEFFTPERMVSGNLDVYREIVTGLHE